MPVLLKSPINTTRCSLPWCWKLSGKRIWSGYERAYLGRKHDLAHRSRKALSLSKNRSRLYIRNLGSSTCLRTRAGILFKYCFTAGNNFFSLRTLNEGRSVDLRRSDFFYRNKTRDECKNMNTLGSYAFFMKGCFSIVNPSSLVMPSKIPSMVSLSGYT